MPKPIDAKKFSTKRILLNCPLPACQKTIARNPPKQMPFPTARFPNFPACQHRFPKKPKRRVHVFSPPNDVATEEFSEGLVIRICSARQGRFESVRSAHVRLSCKKIQAYMFIYFICLCMFSLWPKARYVFIDFGGGTGPEGL
jgi:hypothetical protein